MRRADEAPLPKTALLQKLSIARARRGESFLLLITDGVYLEGSHGSFDPRMAGHIKPPTVPARRMYLPHRGYVLPVARDVFLGGELRLKRPSQPSILQQPVEALVSVPSMFGTQKGGLAKGCLGWLVERSRWHSRQTASTTCTECGYIAQRPRFHPAAALWGFFWICESPRKKSLDLEPPALRNVSWFRHKHFDNRKAGPR